MGNIVNIYKILVGNSDCKRIFYSHVEIREKLKKKQKEFVGESVGWINLAHNLE
jgi:hypothetical protein